MKDMKNNKMEIVQEVLEEWGKQVEPDNQPVNPENELASRVFEGAIYYASVIWANRLSLGGAYHTTRNWEEINECLIKLKNLLK